MKTERKTGKEGWQGGRKKSSGSDVAMSICCGLGLLAYRTVLHPGYHRDLGYIAYIRVFRSQGSSVTRGPWCTAACPFPADRWDQGTSTHIEVLSGMVLPALQNSEPSCTAAC